MDQGQVSTSLFYQKYEVPRIPVRKIVQIERDVAYNKNTVLKIDQSAFTHVPSSKLHAETPLPLFSLNPINEPFQFRKSALHSNDDTLVNAFLTPAWAMSNPITSPEKLWENPLWIKNIVNGQVFRYKANLNHNALYRIPWSLEKKYDGAIPDPLSHNDRTNYTLIQKQLYYAAEALANYHPLEAVKIENYMSVNQDRINETVILELIASLYERIGDSNPVVMHLIKTGRVPQLSEIQNMSHVDAFFAGLLLKQPADTAFIQRFQEVYAILRPGVPLPR